MFYDRSWMKRSNRKYKKSHINRVNNKYNTCNWAGGLLRGAELWTVGQPGAWFKGASVGLGGLECRLYIPRLWHVHTKKAINNRFDIFGHCNWLPFPFPLAFPFPQPLPLPLEGAAAHKMAAHCGWFWGICPHFTYINHFEFDLQAELLLA